MANFSQAQKVTIRRLLGYSNQDALGINTQSITYLNDVLDRDYDQEFIDQVQTILSSIDNWETSLTTAINSSHITRADVIEFDYSNRVSQIEARGSASLRELAQILGVHLNYDKFSSGSTGKTFSYRSA